MYVLKQNIIAQLQLRIAKCIVSFEIIILCRQQSGNFIFLLVY